MTAADPMASFSTTDDALVLASVSSPAERALLSDWLQRQRREHPDSKVDVLELPDGEPPPGVLARLVEELEADEDRTVVPVRVFWVPGGLPTRSKVVALISGPRHLSAAGDSATTHSQEGPVTRAGGGGRTREGFRASPAVERHHASARTRATWRIS